MNRIQGAVTALALVASATFSTSTIAETAAEEGQRLFRELCFLTAAACVLDADGPLPLEQYFFGERAGNNRQVRAVFTGLEEGTC